ncbi:MerR family transcriptional regulator [Shumkonia mesophila]|uniref:hypothetical protein n=1 Tax=Shumkonia mesophila TaxID=2838854 RepID=UPI002934402B|nr:hypothetical protein [Shumkonia mesophila]
MPANDFVDTYFTIAEARDAIERELGIAYSFEQVRRMADARRLPFFKDPAGKRRISRTELFAAFFSAQCEAKKRMAA